MEEHILRKIAGKHKVPYGTIEKDYALTTVLFMISKFPKLDKIIFKGGTALKKAYFENFRFSEDLDFVCLEDISDEFTKFIEENIHTCDIAFKTIANKEKKSNSLTFKIKYHQTNDALTSIKIDMSLRSDVILKHARQNISHIYDTIPSSFVIPVLSLEEVMAEKIRAIIYTKHPRHVFDIHYLHQKGIKINSKVVRQKIKSAYDEDFNMDTLTSRMPEKEKDWILDLRPLLSSPPPEFEQVSKEVIDVISKAMQ